MEEAEYKALNQYCHTIAQLVNLETFDGIDEAIQMAEHSAIFSVYTDPTAWIKNRAALQQDIALMKAVRELRRALPQIAAIKK